MTVTLKDYNGNVLDIGTSSNKQEKGFCQPLRYSKKAMTDVTKVYVLNTANVPLEKAILKATTSEFTTTSLRVTFGNYNLSRKAGDYIRVDNSIELYTWRTGYVKSEGAEYLQQFTYNESFTQINQNAIGDNVGTTYAAVTSATFLSGCEYIVYNYGALTKEGNPGKYIVKRSNEMPYIDKHDYDIVSTDTITLRKAIISDVVYADELDLMTGVLTRYLASDGTLLATPTTENVNLKYLCNGKETDCVIIADKIAYIYTIGNCAMDVEMPVYNRESPRIEYISSWKRDYGDMSIEYGRDIASNTDWTLLVIPKTNYDGDTYRPCVKLTNATNECLQGAANYKTISEYMTSIGTSYVLGINAGIFLIDTNYEPCGVTISDGVVKKSTNEGDGATKSSILTINSSGNLGYSPISKTASQLVSEGITDATTGWVNIINDYVISDDMWLYTGAIANHPRQVIGQFENGDYLVFSCDGRDTDETGMDMIQIANILLSKGVKFAFNLDGGGSTFTIIKTTNGVKQINPDIANSTRVVPVGIFFAKTSGA